CHYNTAEEMRQELLHAVYVRRMNSDADLVASRPCEYAFHIFEQRIHGGRFLDGAILDGRPAGSADDLVDDAFVDGNRRCQAIEILVVCDSDSLDQNSCPKDVNETRWEP